MSPASQHPATERTEAATSKPTPEIEDLSPVLNAPIGTMVSRSPIRCTYIQLNHPSQNKDATYTYVHMQQARDADLFEDFCKDKLPADEIYVPPHLQPINPEDEDDVVPDQHAAFGITKATQKVREPAWKDLGLGELMSRGPGKPGSSSKSGGPSKGLGKRRGGRSYKGLPR
ncbi:hypothetical protein OQA88_6836 [Cercophora sp. LCS_1]